jgi:hypothetical protein
VLGRPIAAALVAGLIIPASGGHAAAPNEHLGSIAIRLVQAQTGSTGDSRARSYIVDRLKPGTTIRRRVEISNNTRSTARIAVYPAAASLRHGRFAFAPGRSRNKLSSWTSVSRAVLRLRSGTKAVETVTINVPRRAPFGNRHAVVWAQVSAPAVTGGVRLVNRVGIRVYLTVGRGGSPRSNFAIGRLTAGRSPSGKPLVTATVRNTGGTMLDIRGNVTLTNGPGGLRAGAVPVTPVRELSPKGSRTVRVQLDDQLPDGPWQAHVRLESGSIKRAATATIMFPGNADHSSRLNPGVIALLILGLVIASFAFWFLRRERRLQSDPEPTVGY